MSVWSGIAKGFSKLFSGGGTAKATWTKTWTSNGVKNIQTVTKVAGEAAQTGARTVITWGNAVKVAVVGGFTWLFLNGGASNVVSSTLGISQDTAQILIIFGFVVMMVLVTRYIINFMKDRFNLKQEYLDTPAVKRVGNRHYNDETKRWER